MTLNEHTNQWTDAMLEELQARLEKVGAKSTKRAKAADTTIDKVFTDAPTEAPKGKRGRKSGTKVCRECNCVVAIEDATVRFDLPFCSAECADSFDASPLQETPGRGRPAGTKNVKHALSTQVPKRVKVALDMLCQENGTNMSQTLARILTVAMETPDIWKD